MELIIISIMVYAFGFFAGWMSHAKSILKRLTDNPDEMIRILNEYKKEQSKIKVIEREDATPAREIEVEQQNGVFYLYAKDNGQFLAQAKTLDEALKIVEQRFPNQSFQGVISSEEAKRMGLSN
jgi:hypothetical protein